MKILVMGWFSFENGHVTAGDLLSRDVLCEWLKGMNISFDVANDPPLPNILNWRTLNPKDYTHVIFVCGPFGNDELESEFLNKFRPYCRIIGLNLSMKQSLSDWNPFDFLIERDSNRITNPDLVFVSRTPSVPLIGICLVEEYDNAMVREVNNTVNYFIANTPAAVVQIDTRLDQNSTALRSPSEIETLISRVDVLITSRLHGLVLALKNGVPAIAIDPERGGSKIRKQCEVLNWEAVINADQLSSSELQLMMNYCLSPKARADALVSSQSAIRRVNHIKQILCNTISDQEIINSAFQKRVADDPELILSSPKGTTKNKLISDLRSSLRKYFFLNENGR